MRNDLFFKNVVKRSFESISKTALEKVLIGIYQFRTFAFTGPVKKELISIK